MTTMILISSVAMLVGIVGSFLIWRFDALRADEIEHAVVPVAPAALPRGAAESPKSVGLG
jgi:ABC-type Mn2+/Zn2+ transport system permease subunit